MNNTGNNFTRRDFLAASTTIAATSFLQPLPLANATSTSKLSQNRRSAQRPNILFVFTDQERFFDATPNTHSLPGHEWLAKNGTTFTNHQISASMCTSSRSVLMTGLQTIDNGMFDNVDTPYVHNLPTTIPTIGHMLRKVGYYTAYKGKWHLNRDFEQAPDGETLNRDMEEYGFADFYSPGDHLAHALGGYQFDQMIAGGAITWLRRKGSAMAAVNQPWGLFVSLINPHDIMYFNADAPNENNQDTGRLLMTAQRAPKHSSYLHDWKYPLPQNLRQSLTQGGRPSAHAEYDRAWGYALGHIPLNDSNWNRFTNFYLNSIRTVDLQLAALFNELDALGLRENTVVVFTSDHGEMGGAHGLRGKGPFAYRESIHVPMYVVHPDVSGGRSCVSLSSHLDIVPSLLSMAGVAESQIPDVAERSLPGKDFTTALGSSNSGLHDIREQTLFAYSGIATNDSEMIRIIAEAKADGKNPKDAIRESGYKPNLKKRGSLRTVFDGRYKFTRYFAPTERNNPQNLEELFANNDVELFDLQNDPLENVNLAVDPTGNRQILEMMNGKMQTAIAQEFGIDDGREMPDFPGITWNLDRLDL